MVVRILLVAALVVVTVLSVRGYQRWTGPVRIGDVPRGLTVVSAPGCRDCVAAKERLDSLGASYRELDVDQARGLGVMSLTVPYAVVGSDTGDVVVVRRGRAVVTDAAILVAAATGVRAPDRT